MLRIIKFSVFMLFVSGRIFSQTPCPTCPPNNFVNDGKEYDVIKTNKASMMSDFVPNQILVKFKDDLVTSLHKTNGSAGIGTVSVDNILQKYKIVKVNKLFPEEKRLLQKKVLKTANGKEIEQPSLHNIYKLDIDSTQQINLIQAVEELKRDPNVIYAEPNYILSIVEDKPVSPALNESEMKVWLANHPEVNIENKYNSKDDNINLNTSEIVNPNDPLYPQQWYLNAVKAEAVWDITTGDTTQIIAILDTGVDWLHPDLKNKIWTNPDEIPGNGIDDDHNGLIDDEKGWDWINNDNNPLDDNSHGTHVAGIAAAEANNGIGIAGINWKAKIMPLKVFQSSGRGDASTITQAIIYAKNKGATVINMSFGSYARSLTMENALINAYATTILVAASGNDGACIGPGSGCAPFFPAALTFVLGTQAPDGNFSNFDQDGPTFSGYEDMLNYEMKAPGTNIISTIPNGGYRVYQGTSMAAPVISGTVSLYKKLTSSESESQELMWVKLIQSTGQFIDLNKVITIKPKPQIWLLSSTLVDTIGTDDKDGRVDAGETIQLSFKVRNTGAQVDSVYWKIKFAEFEDTSVCKIQKSTSYIGSMSSYATRTSESDPMILKINPNVAHDRDISFELLSWYKGSIDTLKQKYVFTVENGEQLAGVMDSTMILTPDKNWLVNNSFKVGGNGNLIIMPGTHITIYKSNFIAVKGIVSAIGKPDSMIVINGPGDGFINAGTDKIQIFKFCLFQNIGRPISSGVSFYGNAKVSDCIFENCGYSSGIIDFLHNQYNYGYNGYGSFLTDVSGRIKYNNFIYPVHQDINVGVFQWPNGIEVKYNNFIRCVLGTIHSETLPVTHQFNSFIYPDMQFISAGYNSSVDIQKFQNQYWGTSKKESIKKMIWDFWSTSMLPQVQFEPFLSSPPDSCPGIVGKVLINGKDAQDEIVDPVGAGPQRFDVYFNRPMDKNYTPQLTFGVRQPYTQQAVSDSGRWSEDGKIYTAYKTIKLYTGDGINRVRVSGARDLENFEIPVEDMRFEFLINAAGSSSADFMAAAGLGKVNLEWNRPPEVPDLLGFNIYRFENLTDTTFTKPAIVNSSLVNDTLYTDFKVTPNKKYYYYYKVVRTDFSESDSSRIVSSVPFTASKGDANGDLKVDVLDITSEVSYLLNQNPQPFIFEAADANSDGSVNVLDIVKIVNLIMGSGVPASNSLNKSLAETDPELIFDSKSVSIKNGSGISALQFKIACSNIKDAQIIPGENVSGMEVSYGRNKDTLTVLIFSYKNNNLPNDKGVLFKINNAQFTKLINVTAGNSSGEQLKVKYANDGFIIPKDYALYQNYPNPFNPSTTIRYALPKAEDIEITIFNILGQRVWSYELKAQDPGYHEIVWNGKTNSSAQVSSGIYIYQIRAGKFVSQKKMVMLK